MMIAGRLPKVSHLRRLLPVRKVNRDNDNNSNNNNNNDKVIRFLTEVEDAPH